jgi:creatinine amidohydrolase
MLRPARVFGIERSLTMQRKFRLQDMTCAEFAERLPEKPVIILPFGAQEEQGPHAPMGDFVLADRLAAMVAERTGAIMAPTMPYGESEVFRSMPGCVALRPSIFVEVVKDLCGSFLDHGLERIVIMNGQTSNAPLIDQALRSIRRERGILIANLNIWRLLTQGQIKAIYGEGDAQRSQGHGGDPITSMFLHLFPELVRKDLIVPPQPWKKILGLPTRSGSAVDFQGVAVPLPLGITDMSVNGNLSGDGRCASAAIGAKTTEHIVNFTCAFVEHMKTCDVRAKS